MTVDLDETDWAILRELQSDARISFTALARAVHLGTSATADRVRRLEAEGVVRGYRAVVDLDAVGVTITAVVRLKHHGSKHRPFVDHVTASPYVLGCVRVTGDDCYVVRIGATSMRQLQDHVDDLARFGDTSTSVVYGDTLPQRGPSRPLG